MAPYPIGLVRPDSADCDRNWKVDPNCPQPTDQDNTMNNDKKVIPFDWNDLDRDKDDVTSTTEEVMLSTQEVTKQIVEKITERILDTARKTTKTEAAQDDTSGTGYQVFTNNDMDQDNTEDSFSVVMMVGGVVVSVVIVGSVGNIYRANLELLITIAVCSVLCLQSPQNLVGCQSRHHQRLLRGQCGWGDRGLREDP